MYGMVGAISTEPVWCSCRFVPGSAVKSGSSARARLILTTPLRVFQCSMSVTKSSGRFDRPTWSRNAVRGCRLVTTTLAVSCWPFSSSTPAARPFFEHDLADPGVGADLGAGLAGGPADGVGDRAHAALLEAPVAQVAVAHVADGVVRHHVGGAGLVGAGPGPDHAVDRERALDLRRLEPVVEQVGDRHRHQPGHVGDRADVQAAVAPGQPEGLIEVTGLARAEVRRHGEQQRAEHVGQAGQPGVPARHRVGVLLRPAGDLIVVALGVVGVELDRAALGEGLVVRAHRVDLVAVPLQLEIIDDRRGQQRHHVGKPGDLEVRGVRPGSFGGRGAAGLRPRLEHQRARARTGQVRRGDQAVVPAADDDRVVVGGSARSGLRRPGGLRRLRPRPPFPSLPSPRSPPYARLAAVVAFAAMNPGPPKD